MIIVHHLNNSRSQRILWLLEELELPYEVKHYERDAQTLLAPSSLKAVHPLGKSPLLTENGQVLAESGAIIEYVLDMHDKGRFRPPPNTPERWRFNYWLHYAEGSAMSPLLLSLIFSHLPKSPMPFFMRPLVKTIAEKVKKAFIGPQLKLHLDYMEAELHKAMWFAGDQFSAADIQMSFVVEASASQGALGARPKLNAYLKRIHERDAYQRALQKGGPYDLLT